MIGWLEEMLKGLAVGALGDDVKDLIPDERPERWSLARFSASWQGETPQTDALRPPEPNCR